MSRDHATRRLNGPDGKKPPVRIGSVCDGPYCRPDCQKKRKIRDSGPSYVTVGMKVSVCSDRRRHGPPLLGQLGTTDISISSCTRRKKRPRSLKVVF